MPEARVRVGGAWQRANKIFARVGGAWTEVRTAFVRVGGAWQPFHFNDVVSISDESITDVGGFSANASLIFRATGGLEAQRANAGNYALPNWLTPPGGGSRYQIRATVQAGSVNGTTGSWLSLGSDQSWFVASIAGGGQSCSLLIEIRRASDGVVVDSATYNLGASSSP